MVYKKTLKDFILYCKYSLKGQVFIDIGAPITIKGNQGLEHKSSPNKGVPYRVLDILDKAKWNPNQLRTTLIIEYENQTTGETKIEQTYLDERLNDESRSQDW